MQNSGESLLENHDDALHEVDELAERWQNRLSLNNTRFVERYVKCEMGVGIEVGFKKDRSKKFVSFFEREGRLRLVDRCGRVVPLNKELYFTESRPGRNYAPMFVDNVKLVQLPEGVSLPSTVRLQSSNDFFSRGTDALKEEKSLSARQPNIIPTYWEVSILNNAWIGDPGPNNKRDCEAVHRASQVVDGIADDGTPCLGHGFFDADLINFYRGLRIFIQNDFIRVSVPVGFDLSDKVVKVFYGPVDLYPATEQRITVHGQA